MSSNFEPTFAELALVNRIFAQADAQKIRILTLKVAAKVFKSSGLPPTVLGEIWSIADSRDDGFLTEKDVCIAVRLIGHAQKGHKVDQSLVNKPGPLATIGCVPQFTSQWDVTPAEKARADFLFDTLDLQRRGFIEGDVAVPFMLQSKLPEDVLAQVWDLADINNDGRLTRDGFAVAMHIIQGNLSGKDVPSMLPPPMRAVPFVAAPAPARLEPVRDSLWDDSPPPSATALQPISSSSSNEWLTLPKVPGIVSESSGCQGEISKLNRTHKQLEQELADHRIQLDNARQRLEQQSQELVTQHQELATRQDAIDAGLRKIKLLQKIALESTSASKSSIDVTKLEDMLSCNICTELMHSPYLLQDCGHSNCEGCLKGWFDETLINHIVAHPTYDIRNPTPRNLPQLLQTFSPYILPQSQVRLRAIFDTLQRRQPKYTCPSCRKEVTGKPIPNYAVKALVSKVGGILGQSDEAQHESSTSGPKHQPGPFDGFFP